MWLHKLKFKLNKYWIENTFLDTDVNSKYLGYISIFDPEQFNKHSLTDACMYKLKVLYPNITLYINNLRYINALLESNSDVKNNWCRYDYMDTTLENFLIYNSFELNAFNVMQEFKTEYTIFCKQILSIEKDLVNPQEHNLRILTQFSSHLNELTLSLIRYTLL